jgi:hypothetical protein
MTGNKGFSTGIRVNVVNFMNFMNFVGAAASARNPNRAGG